MVKRVKLRQRAKFRGDSSNRLQDVTIFRLFKMAAAAWIFKFVEIFKGRTAQEGRSALLCQIWLKSAKPRPRYGDFSIFQDCGRCHLGLFKFKLLTVGQLKRVELRCRAIFVRNRPYCGRDMAIFQFFKMTAAAILDFSNFKLLMVGRLKRVELHCR